MALMHVDFFSRTLGMCMNMDVILPEKPDIVISYSAWCHDLIAFTENTKSVKYIHGDPGTNPDYRNEAIEHKDLLSRFDRIVCVSDAVRKVFDLRPAAIISYLDLRRPIYRQTAAYGHFGRPELNLPWEQVNQVEALLAAVKE